MTRFDPPSKPAVLHPDTKLWLIQGLSVFLVVLVIVLLIVGLVQSQRGPGDSDHPIVLPAGVAMLNGSNYIVTARDITAGNICWGTDQNSVSVYTDRYIAPLHGYYISCASSQNWNVHTKVGPTIFVADLHWLEHPGVDVGAVLVFLLMMSPGSIKALSDWRAYRRKARAYHAGLEDIRRELRAAYAKEEIDDLEFRQALDRLYAVGVKPERDASLPKEIEALG